MVKKSPSSTDVHVGARVRMRRMMLSMSQEKLGGALGLTFQQVQKYEKGTNRISASKLQEISQILHVPVSFFFEGVPEIDGSTFACLHVRVHGKQGRLGARDSVLTDQRCEAAQRDCQPGRADRQHQSEGDKINCEMTRTRGARASV